jgi:hypothetical protein
MWRKSMLGAGIEPARAEAQGILSCLGVTTSGVATGNDARFTRLETRQKTPKYTRRGTGAPRWTPRCFGSAAA